MDVHHVRSAVAVVPMIFLKRLCVPEVRTLRFADGTIEGGWLSNARGCGNDDSTATGTQLRMVPLSTPENRQYMTHEKKKK